MDSKTKLEEGTPQEKLVRYEFWSLIKALESGLTHSGLTPVQRAKKIVASMAAMQPAERQAALKAMGNVVTYLGALEREAEGGRKSAAGTETVELNSVRRVTPSE